MAEYQAYAIGPDGKIEQVESLVCANDAEAMNEAMRIFDGRAIELWSGSRFVVLLPGHHISLRRVSKIWSVMRS